MDLSEETELCSFIDSAPRYQQIACDLASKIADGTYQEGQRLSARSALAGQYGVSTETARRAICILSDLGIVQSIKGSGVRIISAEKAVDYLRNLRKEGSVEQIKSALLDSVEKQQQEARRVAELLDELVEQSDRFKATNPFVPYHVTVPKDCPLIGMNLKDSRFRSQTLATVVGIRRGERLKLSPGPDVQIMQGDILYYICDPECVSKVTAFLHAK